ncbi:MAG: hypothetical protein ACTSSK_07875 [Candidatus Heimdallarchaeota archaeon]
MRNNKRQIMITMVIISLFALTVYSPPIISGKTAPIAQPFRINGTELFVENFTTTTFKDPGTTTPGWSSDEYLHNTRNSTWTLLDSFATSQIVYDLDVQGRKVFYAGYNPVSSVDSLVALDINNPSVINFCSARTSLPAMMTIAIDGNAGYTGTGLLPQSGSINTYNVSDPYNLNGAPVFLVGAPTDGLVTDIETNGHLVYYTVYNSSTDRSLRLLDAENPAFPVYYTTDFNTEMALGLEVQNNLAYVAAGLDGLYILDVHQKETVIELSHLPLLGNATDVIVDGNIAYIAAGGFVHTVDVSNPSDPILLDSFDNIFGLANDLVKQGDTLYVADAIAVFVFDVADPENIQMADAIGPFMDYARCIDLYGGVLVVGTNAAVYTLQVGSLGGNGMLDFSSERAQYPNHFTDLQSWDVRVDGKIAYIAGGPDGFYTLDVRNPHEPEVLDHFETPPGQIAKKLEKHGNYIYCTTGAGLFVFDVTDPTNIIDTTFQARVGALDVAISGDVAFVSLDGTALSGFAAYNISQPGNAVFMYNEVFGTNITSLDVEGPHLYVVDDVVDGFAPSFYIFQLLDLSNPVLTSNNTRWALHYDICVDGDVAYMASTVWSSLYDVQDPFSPSFLWDIDYGGSPINASGVWQFGPYTLTAGNDDGIYLVYNPMVSAPSSTLYDGVDDAKQITVEGDFTYAACLDEFVILRHYESAGGTFWANTTEAISLQVNPAFGDGELTTATLFADDFIQGGSSIKYFMSADNGVHWEEVENGIALSFVNRGEELLWKAEVTSLTEATPRIYQIEIEYTYNLRPTEPTLTAIDDKFTGMIKATWTASIDDVTIDHYQVQLSDSIGFTNILADKTTNMLSKSFVTGKTGTIYVRVRAVDGEGLMSAWNLEQFNVAFSAGLLFGIIGGAAVIIAVVVIIIVLVVKKKKVIPER